MERQWTPEEAERHDALYMKGWSLIDGLILLGTAAPNSRPGWLARRRLLKAQRCFEEALRLNPDGWQSMWALGKIQQRLGNGAEALRNFGRAHDLDPSQADTAREAGIQAIELGRFREALRYSEAAVKANPDDPGLVSNLALAHLLGGDLSEARRAASDAVTRAPQDEASRFVQSVVEAVVAGQRPRPQSVAEIAG
jgi:tetratricopeptide (TPR) repeat protein